MKRFTLPIVALIMALLASASQAAKIELSSTTAAPTKMNFGGRDLPLASSGGGFVIHDFNARRDVTLGGGQVTPDGGFLKFAAASEDLSLTAVFTSDKNAINVSGEIESRVPNERALIVRYTLPLPAEGALFEDEISHSQRVAADTQCLGTVFPLAAMTGSDWGAALAIPPTFPCCFGMTGSQAGLGVEFYLGVSPQTRAFPNRAAFHFVIHSADAGWGFRSALASYYGRYPEYYKPRIRGGGFWNWQEKGEIEHALPLFRLQGVPHYGGLGDEIKRNQAFNILTFDYVIVGQREVRELPDLPSDYAGAMAVYEAFAKQWRDEPQGPLRQKYRHWREKDLPDLIERCATAEADGHFRIRPRDTVWGKNSITFTMNPNPDLFRDKGWDNVGSTTLKQADQWMVQDPIDGIMVDSLGAQWPSTLNFRQDHFTYARYPLTFDKEGRVALHNRISHYEFLESLRSLAAGYNKLLFANGVYRYRRPQMDEHYNGVENGRFFMSALLDAAGREQTAMFDRETLEFFRTAFGQKLFAPLLYKWSDADDVRRQLNRALAFAVFAGPIRCFTDDVSYLKSKEGYYRDRDLLEWFVKQCRILHDAGWQPVTHARVNQPDIVCERYGSGDVVYFALVNLGAEPIACEVAIDLAALRMSPQEGEMAHVAEIATKTRITDKTEGETSRVRLTLEPDRAQILKLSRAW